MIVRAFHIFKSPGKLHVWRQGSFISGSCPRKGTGHRPESQRQFFTLIQGYYLPFMRHISEYSHRWCFRKFRLQPKRCRVVVGNWVLKETSVWNLVTAITGTEITCILQSIHRVQTWLEMWSVFNKAHYLPLPLPLANTLLTGLFNTLNVKSVTVFLDLKRLSHFYLYT